MRVSRAWVGGREVAALEHEGRYFRVDKLDEVLGAPFPEDLRDRVAEFQTRVFGLKLAGLEDHTEAIAEGTRLDDARVGFPPGRLLPPTSASPAVIELVGGRDDTLSTRLNGRALFGHESMGLLPRGTGPLWVSPAIAVVVGDDLHLCSPAEARRAVVGRCLALAWSLAPEEQQARQHGMGAGPGREAGTHIGPFLTIDPGFGLATPLPPATTQPGGAPSSETFELALEADGERTLGVSILASIDRVGRALAAAARFADVLAGDVLLVTSGQRLRVEPGQPVSVRAAGLGALRGQVGSG
jgi:hypothetical protein